MADTRSNHSQEQREPSDRSLASGRPGRAGRTPPRLLIVSDRTIIRDGLIARLGDHASRMLVVNSSSEAVEAISAENFDAAIIDAELASCGGDAPDGFDLGVSLGSVRPQMALIVVHPRPPIALAMRALHAKIDDIVPPKLAPADLARRIDSAIERRRTWFGISCPHATPVEPAAPIRPSTRDDVAIIEQSGPGSGDPARGPSQRDAGIPGFSIGQLSDQLAEELDLESALRLTLEWLHAQVGPTSAAVLLPNDHDEWALGAYINSSFQREQAEEAFDALAEQIGPKLEEEGEFCWALDEAGVRALVGAAAGWVSNCEIAASPCWSEQRCRAVLAIFRDRSRGYTEEQVAALVAASRVFGRQLGVILRVHHRRRVTDYLDDTGWGGREAA